MRFAAQRFWMNKTLWHITISVFIGFILSISTTIFGKTLEFDQVPNGFAFVFVKDWKGKTYSGLGVVLKEGKMLTSAHLFTSPGWWMRQIEVLVKTNGVLTTLKLNMNAVQKSSDYMGIYEGALDPELRAIVDFNTVANDFAILKVPDSVSKESSFELDKANTMTHNMPQLNFLSMRSNTDPNVKGLVFDNISLNAPVTNYANKIYISTDPNGIVRPGDSGGPLFYNEQGVHKVIGLVSASSKDRSLFTSVIGPNRETIENEWQKLRKNSFLRTCRSVLSLF